MKFKTFVFTLALIILTGCTATQTVYVPPGVREAPPVTAEGVVTCVNHQDEALDFSYHPDNASVWHSNHYDVHVYLIDTTSGDQIAINSLELENYECSKPHPNK